jgi:Holliday junction resolvase RusA-like endonuclease
MYFIIDGAPVAKGRPRFGNGRTYTPQKTRDAEEHIAESARYSLDCPKKPLICPLEAVITFYMPIPPSWSEKKRRAHLGEPHTQRPDASNLVKTVEDALNGIIYEDDAQVWHITAKKVWSNTGKTEVQFFT